MNAPEENSRDAYIEQPITQYQRTASGAWSATTTHDAIAEEVPVALSYNGIAHAVMMATPLDLEDFAVGFSLSEGIVDRAAQIHDIEASDNAQGIALNLHIAAEHFSRLKEKRRSLIGRSGCGVCGSESLAQLDFSAPCIEAAERVVVAPETLLKAFAQLQDQQRLNGRTGAVHAAAWATLDGALVCVREDLGRHNALDKLIGHLARQRQARAPGFALLTSRASYELVQKAARARMPLVAAISAPTTLAIQIAQDCGMALVGFARADRFVVYAGKESIAGALPTSLDAR